MPSDLRELLDLPVVITALCQGLVATSRTIIYIIDLKNENGCSGTGVMESTGAQPATFSPQDC